MGPVTAIRPAMDSGMRQQRSGAGAGGRGEPSETGRALVPVASAAPDQHLDNALPRPSAAFLTQLIAARRKLPQARERRRAEPREAIAAYTAVARAA